MSGDPFAMVMGGASRGALGLDELAQADPPPRAYAAMTELLVEVTTGRTAPAFAVLREHAGQTGPAPLLTELRGALAAHFCVAEHAEQAPRNRVLLADLRLRNNYSDVLLGLDEDASMHLWPGGARYANLLDVTAGEKTLCGIAIADKRGGKLVRGTWQRRHNARCLECAAHADEYEDCAESTEYPALGESRQDRWTAALGGRLLRAVQDLADGRLDNEEFRQLIRDEYVTVRRRELAGECVRGGRGLLARILDWDEEDVYRQLRAYRLPAGMAPVELLDETAWEAIIDPSRSRAKRQRGDDVKARVIAELHYAAESERRRLKAHASAARRS